MIVIVLGDRVMEHANVSLVYLFVKPVNNRLVMLSQRHDSPLWTDALGLAFDGRDVLTLRRDLAPHAIVSSRERRREPRGDWIQRAQTSRFREMRVTALSADDAEVVRNPIRGPVGSSSGMTDLGSAIPRIFRGRSS